MRIDAPAAGQSRGITWGPARRRPRTSEAPHVGSRLEVFAGAAFSSDPEAQMQVDGLKATDRNGSQQIIHPLPRRQLQSERRPPQLLDASNVQVARGALGHELGDEVLHAVIPIGMRRVGDQNLTAVG